MLKVFIRQKLNIKLLFEFPSVKFCVNINFNLTIIKLQRNNEQGCLIGALNLPDGTLKMQS